MRVAVSRWIGHFTITAALVPVALGCGKDTDTHRAPSEITSSGTQAGNFVEAEKKAPLETGQQTSSNPIGSSKSGDLPTAQDDEPDFACKCDGQRCRAEERFPATDGCNRCFCAPNGSVGCTRIACHDPPPGESDPVDADPKVNDPGADGLPCLELDEQACLARSDCSYERILCSGPHAAQSHALCGQFECRPADIEADMCAGLSQATCQANAHYCVYVRGCTTGYPNPSCTGHCERRIPKSEVTNPDCTTGACEEHGPGKPAPQPPPCVGADCSGEGDADEAP